MPKEFDHEKLKVYQQSLQFVALATSLLVLVPKATAADNQLDRASTAIPLNIAEGTGKWTTPDRGRFYDIARGSALECAACLDVLGVKRLLGAEGNRGWKAGADRGGFNAGWADQSNCAESGL